MTGATSIEVDVYKTPRKPNTFVYVPKDLLPAQWPEGLSEVFDRPEKVMSLTLTAKRPLAAQPATVVMEAIATSGYFLQLPPSGVSERLIEEDDSC
jgi:uncharacterized protein